MWNLACHNINAQCALLDNGIPDTILEAMGAEIERGEGGLAFQRQCLGALTNMLWHTGEPAMHERCRPLASNTVYAAVRCLLAADESDELSINGALRCMHVAAWDQPAALSYLFSVALDTIEDLSEDERFEEASMSILEAFEDVGLYDGEGEDEEEGDGDGGAEEGGDDDDDDQDDDDQDDDDEDDEDHEELDLENLYVLVIDRKNVEDDSNVCRPFFVHAASNETSWTLPQGATVDSTAIIVDPEADSAAATSGGSGAHFQAVLRIEEDGGVILYFYNDEETTAEFRPGMIVDEEVRVVVA